MQGPEQYLGEILDDKYRLEQLLGSGGMGAVYLATHLGTERYVALKLISPQFMRNREFVERFKREARAAGRLRHPNVVDVTDFGFAHVKQGEVAYLVMEYLDGCSLADVLAEEQRLPLEWVADILEQVCSAVHEAHQQGIVHRDLKPDNIWLEPNRLGSYRVKVLDFGIAKVGAVGTQAVDEDSTSTIIDNVSAERAAEATTNILPANLETDTLLRQTGDAVGTLLQNEKLTQPFVPGDHAEIEEDGTLLFDANTRAAGPHTEHHSTSAQGPALTRVGAIMGTPLYMSPEQCGGGYVDTRSDIYSLGVIAYQMLAGEPPFAGPTSTVRRAHREQRPVDLRERAEKKIPKRVAGVVMSALSKNPAERPQTAFAFGSALRGETEGIGALYRRAFSWYSEYFPKFLKLSFIAHIPVIITTVLFIAVSIAEVKMPPVTLTQKIVMTCALGIAGLLKVVSVFVAGGVISGATAVIITQLSAAPLRPVQLRTAFRVIRKRWRPFLKTMLMVTWRILLGMLLVIPGLIMMVRYTLYAPVVLIEGLEKKPAMRRARELASRSWRTIIIVVILQILIPSIVSGILGGLIGASFKVNRNALSYRIFEQLLALNQIFILPLMSIVPALLYIKMRQLGGEQLSASLAQIEEGEVDRSKWQQRMRTRLSLHTPTTQKTTTGASST
ncbi:MAG TPA: serine/threonine-protein kinase [Pyrinomonadaceae bacterium]|nr:serine/threonine-protein kinase [Pyrinomonadaceae bacterium]